jgi:hypothetical protein
MIMTRAIDTETGTSERIKYETANADLKVYDNAGHTVYGRTDPAQGTPEDSTAAPVAVLFVHSKAIPEDNDPGGKLLAVFEITDAAYPDHNTEG